VEDPDRFSRSGVWADVLLREYEFNVLRFVRERRKRKWGKKAGRS
jgi:hypothetical protein